ncbi:hypothetical protein STEG23_030402 [Scotinomys teguina]
MDKENVVLVDQSDSILRMETICYKGLENPGGDLVDMVYLRHLGKLHPWWQPLELLLKLCWNLEKNGLEPGEEWSGTWRRMVWNLEKNGREPGEEWSGTWRRMVGNLEKNGREPGEEWSGTWRRMVGNLENGLGLDLGMEQHGQMIHSPLMDLGFCLLLMDLGLLVHTSGLHMRDSLWCDEWRNLIPEPLPPLKIIFSDEFCFFCVGHTLLTQQLLS